MSRPHPSTLSTAEIIAIADNGRKVAMFVSEAEAAELLSAMASVIYYQAAVISCARVALNPDAGRRPRRADPLAAKEQGK